MPFKSKGDIFVAGPNARGRVRDFFAAYSQSKHQARLPQRGAPLFRVVPGASNRRAGPGRDHPPAAYIEEFSQSHSRPTVKQHLAALKMLFDWLVLGQVIPANPTSVVRGTSHSQKRGKTPVLTPGETRELLDSIEKDTLIGLRDRALIALLVYSFSHVGGGGGHAARRLLHAGAPGLGPIAREGRQTA